MPSVTAGDRRPNPAGRTMSIICFLIGLTLVATASLSAVNMWRAQRQAQPGAVQLGTGTFSSSTGKPEGMAPQVTRRYASRLTDGAPMTAFVRNPAPVTTTFSASKSRMTPHDG